MWTGGGGGSLAARKAATASASSSSALKLICVGRNMSLAVFNVLSDGRCVIIIEITTTIQY